ncbi:MAG: hypothetical protein ACT4PZ_12280 [Panacagrimonas sp.]
MGAVALLAVCLLGGIVYMQWSKNSEAPATGPAAVEEIAEAADAGTGPKPLRSALEETRREVVEKPLEKAKAVGQDRFAAPVTHVADNDVCRSLRSARARVQEGMAKPHTAAQAKEFQLDLKSISQRGATEGCWSGGA